MHSCLPRSKISIKGIYNGSLQGSSTCGNFYKKPPGEHGRHRARRLAKRRGRLVLRCSKRRWLPRCTSSSSLRGSSASRGKDCAEIPIPFHLSPYILLPFSSSPSTDRKCLVWSHGGGGDHGSSSRARQRRGRTRPR
ncbi:hypothetical protein BDA96_01G442500 [Sorghum bicolor]|nr:hypothetical protein BDA96_01G442500 [Sorghum bicolor]